MFSCVSETEVLKEIKLNYVKHIVAYQHVSRNGLATRQAKINKNSKGFMSLFGKRLVKSLRQISDYQVYITFSTMIFNFLNFFSKNNNNGVLFKSNSRNGERLISIKCQVLHKNASGIL